VFTTRAGCPTCAKTIESSSLGNLLATTALHDVRENDAASILAP
jgi:hypothetical protein